VIRRRSGPFFTEFYSPGHSPRPVAAICGAIHERAAGRGYSGPCGGRIRACADDIIRGFDRVPTRSPSPSSALP